MPMLIFSGSYNATIDDKKRVVLPAAFKKVLGDMADRVLVVELDLYGHCLNLYPAEAWEKRLAMIEERVNPDDPEQSLWLDRFYQGFVSIGVATNGRLNIPNSFLQEVGISKDVVFTGQGRRIRLWDAARLAKDRMSDDRFRTMSASILGGGKNPLGGVL